MEKKERKYQVTVRENDILYALWKAGRPLLASEIASDELKLTTVHTTLKRMLKKNMVEVVDFTKSGNVFGRCYQPTISLRDYEMDNFCSTFQKSECHKDVTITGLMEKLLDDLDDEEVKKELDELEQVIKVMREQIKEEDEGTP